jgi:hypothetical protein
MKKLLTMTSVLLAGFFGTAQADVSVSGSAGLSVTSVGDATNITNSGAVKFGLSTTLENGMTISSSGLSLGIDGDSLTDATVEDADAFYNLTFSSGGTSLTIGADVENDFADLGVGGVAGDAVSIGLGTGTSVLSTGDDVGAGFALSTSLGGASVKLGYIYDDANATNAADFGGTGLDTATALQVSLPIGPLSATIGYQDNDNSSDGVNMTGASVAYAVAGGTVKVAYVSADSVAANTDAVQTSGSYSTTLADGTAVAIGYSSTDEDAVAVTTDMEVSVSRSIGTGVSMFIDFHNRNSVASGEKSAVAIGTSVSF